METRIEFDRTAIEAFCRRWKLTELSFFGSVLRDDFRPDSDVDIIVSFSPEEHYTLFDLGAMKGELEELFGRNVDIMTRRGLEEMRNPYRRAGILENPIWTLYAA